MTRYETEKDIMLAAQACECYAVVPGMRIIDPDDPDRVTWRVLGDWGRSCVTDELAIGRTSMATPSMVPDLSDPLTVQALRVLACRAMRCLSIVVSVSIDSTADGLMTAEWRASGRRRRYHASGAVQAPASCIEAAALVDAMRYADGRVEQRRALKIGQAAVGGIQ